MSATHREITCQILLNLTNFRLQFHFSNLFGAKRNYVWHQINQKSVITIRIEFNNIQKKIFLCIYTNPSVHDATLRATSCSNRWPEPFKQRVELKEGF